MGDAAALAEVLLEVLGPQPKPVTDEQRARVASRSASLAFGALKPYCASLERDPVHPAACYLSVDGVDGQPLLLRAAPATSPSSGLFPKAILIGRTHLKRFEVVLNAIPFGPGDRERIAAFSEELNAAFQPRRAGSRPVILVRAAHPAEAFPAAFEAFRRLMKTTGLNQAAFALWEGQDAEEFYFATVWSAIRAGWREGYALRGPSSLAIPGVRRKPYEGEIEAVARTVEIPAGAAADEIGSLIG
jgi:hypothetical protein